MLPRILLLFTTFALAFLLSADARAAGTAVTEVDQGHEIAFGDSIRVWAMVESPAPISEARLIYRAEGTGRVSTYNYAAITTAGVNARIESAIPTSGGAYLPPGVRLDVRFELTFADGATSTVGAQTIAYLDPQRDWSTLQREGLPVELVYYGLSDSAAEALLTEAANRLPGVAAALGVDYGSLPGWMAVVYPSIDEFTGAFPPTSQAATDNRFFGGFAMGEYHLLVQASPSPRRFTHELTHLMIDRATSSPLAAPVPSWLHEGLAEYYETASSTSADQYIRQTAPNRLQRIAAMNRMPGRSEDISVFYPQSASFVGYLIKEHGEQRMASLLAAINDGQRVAAAFETAYEFELVEAEEGWRRSLGLPPVLPEAPSTDATTTPSPGPQTPTVQPTTTASPVDGRESGSQSVLMVSVLVGAAMLMATMWLISSRLRHPHR